MANETVKNPRTALFTGMQITFLAEVRGGRVSTSRGKRYTTYYISLPKSLGIDLEKLEGKKIKVTLEIPDELLKP